eukprot:SAG31_NODE_1475_length_8204_cov_18.026280_3_plen_65_part_00
MSLAGLCKAETEGKLDGVVDNTMLTHLNEANLLDNIRSRFDRDIIYVSRPFAEALHDYSLLGSL